MALRDEVTVQYQFVLEAAGETYAHNYLDGFYEKAASSVRETVDTYLAH